MRTIAILMFMALLATCISCGIAGSEDSLSESNGSNDSTNADASSAEIEVHEAMTVANKVLAAIQDGDPVAIRPYLNANNREASDEQIAGFMQESKTEIGTARTASELREGRSEGTVYAKIRDAGDEVFVVVLTLENGKYLFEDINSPAKDSYEALTKIE